jgi:hypothetical protein
MTVVTDAQREAILEVWNLHTQPELEQDLDAVMETIPEDVDYELHPLGLRITKRAAVREMYARVLPRLFERIERHENRCMWVGEAGIASEDVFDVRMSDGEIRKMACVTICPIDVDRKVIGGERVYFTQEFAEVAEDALGPDFANIDGVSRLY